jgi:magnesium transporter
MSRVKLYLPEVKELISSGNKRELKDILDDLYPIEIVEIYRELEDEDNKKYLLNTASRGKLIDAFDEMEEEEQIEVLDKFPDKVKALLLNEMAPDERVDLFEELPEEKADDFKKLIKEEAKEEIDLLSKYPSETAGGLMTTEYASVPEDLTAAMAIEKIRESASEKETLEYIYIIDKNKNLKGFIELRDLFLASPKKKIKEFVEENVISVDAHMDQEEVADVIRKYDFNAVPVVENGKLVGIVTVDDAIDVIREENTEDMYKFGAMEPQKLSYMDSGIFTLIKGRIPWLFILATVGFLIITVVESYKDLLTQYVILAAIFPIILGASGNAGSQSATIIIRGLATGEINTKEFFNILKKELLVGILIGLILGFYISLKPMLINKDFDVAVVIILTMPLTMCLATTAGSLLPILFKKLGLDPANMSSPFITTITDLAALFIYLQIAKYFLNI